MRDPRTRVPTPQGGGIAVVAATLVGAWLGAMLTSTGLSMIEWLALSAATILLALTGAIDDIRGLGPAPRLLIQIVAVGLVIASLPDDFAIVPQLRAAHRARAAPARRRLVREPRELHGRHRLDDGRRGRAGHRGRRAARLHRRGAAAAPGGRARAARRDHRLRAVQSAGRAPVSRRRRQPADRAPARLAAADARRPRTISPPQSCCRSTISPMRPSRSRAVSFVARRSGRRIAPTSISARPMAASPSRKSSCAFSSSIVALAGLALVTAIEPDPRVDVATIALGAALVAWLLLTFQRGKR